MRKFLATLLATALLLVTTMGTQVFAMTLTAESKVEVDKGTYEVHKIYRSESYWSTKQYDLETVETIVLNEDTVLEFEENVDKYNYMAVLVGDSGKIYVWYNNCDK